MKKTGMLKILTAITMTGMPFSNVLYAHAQEEEIPEEIIETNATEESFSVAEEIFPDEVSAEEEMSDPEETRETENSDIEQEAIVFYPAFCEHVTIDGVTVTVSAEEGIFPQGAYLSVEGVSAHAKQMVEEAVENERDSNLNVAASYIFNLKVLDEEGMELQPKDQQKVKVSFILDKATDKNLDAAIYHVGADGEAKALDTEQYGSTVEALTDGFSYYEIEFTYESLTYILPGNGQVRLKEILDSVGLNGEISYASCSDNALFTVSDETGEWLLTSKQSFTTAEYLTVRIDGTDYVITVRDPEYFNVWVGMTQVTSDNMEDILNDGGSAKYNPTLHTLILENPAISTLRDESQIYARDMDLVITGYANLNNSSAKYGIKMEGSGNLIIGVGDITANGSRCGIYSTGDVSVDAAVLTARGDENGIYASADITSNNAVITAEGKKNGIYATGSFTMYNGIIDAEGDEYGIWTKNSITVNSGSLQAEGFAYHGMFAKENINIKGGKVEADGKQKGIFAEGNVTISGEADATGGEDGIYAVKEIHLEGKNIDAKGNTGAGIYASGNITIDDGTTKATGNTAGIYTSDGNISIQKESVTAKGDMYGIFAKAGDISIANTINSVTADGNQSAIIAKTLTFDDKILIKEPVSGVIVTDDELYKNIGKADGITVSDHAVLISEFGYTVDFEMNGHGTKPDAQTVKPGQKAAKPADPHEEGYLFTGWYKESSCSNEYDFNAEVNQDITLYAGWKADTSVLIHTVTITSVPYPVKGQTPVTKGAEVIEEGVHMRGIGSWEAYDSGTNEWTRMKNTDTFSIGKIYRPIIYLNPEEGYKFASDMTVTINHRSASWWTYVSDDMTILTVSAVLPIAAVNENLYVVTAGSLNVRTEAGMEGHRLGGLKYGDVIQAEAQLSNWTMIEYEGKTGWVNSSYTALTYSKETAIKPITYTVTGAGAVNVRADISTSAKRIGGLTYGKQVLVTGIRTDDDGEKWLVMDYHGDYGRQLGYVVAKYTHTDSAVEFTNKDLEDNGKSAEEDTGSETVTVSGVDPVSIQFGPITLYSKIAHGNTAVLEEENYETGNDGTYYVTIYPDDAHNYNALKITDIQLPAEWKLEVMEMTLQDDGGVYLRFGPVNPVKVTFESDNGDQQEVQYVSNGNTVSEPKAPEKEGYTFAGWYKDESCTQEFDFTQAVTEDTTVYAKWIQPAEDIKFYSIQYDLNGGTLDGKTGIVSLSIEEGTVITLPLPERDGYIFDYWQGSRYAAGQSYTVEKDHTFTAQWKKIAAASDTGKTSADQSHSAKKSPDTKDANPMMFHAIIFFLSMISILTILYERIRYSDFRR